MAWLIMRDSDNSSNDIDNEVDNKTQEDNYESLARQLLSEEELRYFSGDKKRRSVKKSVFVKRKASKESQKNHPEHDLSYTITKTVASPKDHQNESKIYHNKTSAVLASQGRGLQILIASIILVLLLLVAIIFALKATDNLATKDLSSADSKSLVDPATDKQSLSAKEPINSHLSDNQQLTSVEDDFDSSASSINDNAASSVPVANRKQQIDSATEQPVVKPASEPEPIAKEQSTPQNDKQVAVSYEDFAKEAQITIYRDSDY